MNRDTFFFLVVLIIFFMISDNGKLPVTDLSEHALREYKDILKIGRKAIQQGHYGQGYGNLTGFKLSYEDNLQDKNALLWPLHNYSPTHPWKESQQDSILPDVVSNLVKSFWGQDKILSGEHSYLLNISGDVYGEFQISHNASQLKPYRNQLPSVLEQYYESLRNQKYEEEKQRYEDDPENNQPPQEIGAYLDKIGNITKYSTGDLILRIRSLESSVTDIKTQRSDFGIYNDAVLVTLLIELRNHQRTDSNSFEMFAVYFQDTGSIVGLTHSAKFMGLHALPHLTMNSDNFERATKLISRLLNLTSIDNDITIEDLGRSVEGAQTKCELATFFQLEKTSYDKTQLTFIDDELKNPQGLPLPKKIPRIEISRSILYSPDCGILFESKKDSEFIGIRREVKFSQFRMVLFFVLLLAILELRLFMRQTKFSRTPSSLSNVSTITIGILSGYDLLIAMAMTLIMWLTELYLICACLAVFYILVFYVFQLRYLLIISAIQANERGSTWRELLRGSTVRDSRQRDLEAQLDSSPNPVSNGVAQPTPQTEVQQQPLNIASPNSPMQYAFVSFFISVSVTLFVLNVVSWSIRALRVFEYFVLIAFNSFLLPQFLRNTLKNKLKTLLWEFGFGTALVRLIPLYYLCLDKSNPFRHPYDPILAAVITAWLLAQLLLLFCQSKLGARFWVNSKWLPEQYNYQPTLTLKDLQSGFSSEILSHFKPEQRDGVFLLCEIDCAICMSPLTLPILMSESSKDKANNHLMKRILVTPCHHIFHLECLEGWMVQKLQCPVCRTALPPI